MESGGTYDNMTRLKLGDADVVTTSAISGLQDLYTGTGKFEGDPMENCRGLYGSILGPYPIVVRADVGIDKPEDLTGKKFNPGKPGGGENFLWSEIVAPTLGIEPDYYQGITSEAVAAMKNREIVGYIKMTRMTKLDASMLDIMTAQPIKFIGFTKEQIEQLNEVYPRFIWAYIEKGQYAELPEVGGFYNWATVLIAATSTDLPQYAGYRLVKAIFEHTDEVQATFPDFDLVTVEQQIEQWSGFTDIPPMHAGVIQYWKEKGADVPAKLIPPEYKEVS